MKCILESYDTKYPLTFSLLSLELEPKLYDCVFGTSEDGMESRMGFVREGKDKFVFNPKVCVGQNEPFQTFPKLPEDPKIIKEKILLKFPDFKRGDNYVVETEIKEFEYYQKQSWTRGKGDLVKTKGHFIINILEKQPKQ